MMFGEIVMQQTRSEYFSEIAKIVADDRVLIFFDTNILAYLYRLHAGAREEFFSWTDSLVEQKRLRIPAWAASEYLSRVQKDRLIEYAPNKALIKQLETTLRLVEESASQFVDDTVLQGKGLGDDRDEVLRDFKRVIRELQRFTPLFRHSFDVEAIHTEIQDRLSPAIMDSDIAEHCARAGREGGVRIQHRLPPGFCDADKKENPLGDLIIWFEIMEEAKAVKSDYDGVIFVTNDAKSDWVYAPDRRLEEIKGGRKAVPNITPILKMIDPRLRAEFKRSVGHAQITICGVTSLVDGLSVGDRDKFKQLLSAIQVNFNEVANDINEEGLVALDSMASGALALDGEGELAEVNETGTSSGCPLEATAGGSGLGDDTGDTQLIYGLDALRDEAYEYDVASEINNIINDLRTHNWYRQNPAVEVIKTIRDKSFGPNSWFVLGRNIYQAADGGAQKAREFMRNLDIHLERFPLDTRKHLLAGMLCEIYCDKHGDLREWSKTDFMESPLTLVESPEFTDVRTFIRAYLEKKGSRLRFLPGDSQVVPLRLTSINSSSGDSNERRHELQSVTVDGIELMKGVPEGPRQPSFSIGGDRREWTVRALAERVSHAFVIPMTAIERQFVPHGVRPDNTFVVPDGWRMEFDETSREWNSGH